mmetsp:Transcript_34662/g.68860  ORF Transcript_34662/g.68860 Transcript_34662/m.68860 type:complete len:235 (-) Transcript_34662:11-715(-)
MKMGLSTLDPDRHGDVKLYLSLGVEPTPFNSATTQMLNGVSNSHVKTYSSVVLTFLGPGAVKTILDWKKTWVPDLPVTEVASAGSIFDPRKIYSHADVLALQTSQVRIKAAKKGALPMLDMAVHDLVTYIAFIKKVKSGFYAGISSIQVHCSFCKRALYLKDATPMPMWCLQETGEVHRQCTEHSTWGGEDLPENDLDDDVVGGTEEGCETQGATGRNGEGDGDDHEDSSITWM